MSKRSRRERAVFRGELLQVLRELVVVGRRLAAVSERRQALRDLQADHWPGEPNGLIHTRGPLEGQEIEQEKRQ